MQENFVVHRGTRVAGWAHIWLHLTRRAIVVSRVSSLVSCATSMSFDLNWFDYTKIAAITESLWFGAIGWR